MRPPIQEPKASPLWHTLTDAESLSALGTHLREGLRHDEIAQRLTQYGPNSLPVSRRRGPWLRFALQFHNPLIYVLLGAGAVTFALQDYVDAGVIAGVVFINALIGFIQEGKAEKALGPKFDIKSFHDLLIASGSQPLSILERRVDDWIAARK